MDLVKIGRCFFPADNPLDADVALVFGMNDWRRPADHAIALYRQGLARRLLFTGGYNPSIEAHEAREMASWAYARGVPETAILIEPEARHTQENMRFSSLLLAELGIMDNIRCVNLVAIQYHFRRAYLAARRHLPEGLQIGWSTYPSRHYDASDWYLKKRGREDVASEIRKIEAYYGLTLDDLMPQSR